MALSASIQQDIQIAGVVRTKTNTFTGTVVQRIEKTINDAQTDVDIDIAMDVSQIQAIYIVADVAMTLETNDGTTPAETISLVANVPYVWHTNDYFTNLLATDITSLFVTNASGSNGTFTLEALLNE